MRVALSIMLMQECCNPVANSFDNGKMNQGCASKNKALITLVSCDIWRDISLAISHADSCNKSYIYDALYTLRDW